MDKKALSERDVCTEYITPAIAKAGWDVQVQVREDVHLTKGRVIVRGRMVTRGTAKFADYVLYEGYDAADFPVDALTAEDGGEAAGSRATSPRARTRISPDRLRPRASGARHRRRR